MSDNTLTSTQITTIDGGDGFDSAAKDPSASPIRGVNVKFVDGEYYSFKDKLDVRERTFVVLDRREGWQFLKRDCPPEYLMRAPGGPRPPQPNVVMAEWPKNLNGVAEHPWKFTRYLYLLDAATGEISTFWSNTVGGRIAVDELNDQVVFMRKMRPGAHPVVQLRSAPMPTSYGRTKPRPYLKLAGWKQADGVVEQLQLTGPTAEAPSTPAAIAEKSAAPKTPHKTSKRGTKTTPPAFTAVEEPTIEEILDDEIGF